MRIAISGESGCGNTTATRNVAKALELEVINFTFRELALELGVTFEEVQKASLKHPWLDYKTDVTVISRVEKNDHCVVGSRLAAWSTDSDVRVWLEAPLEIRAARIAHREKKPVKQVELETLTRDEANAKAYERLYGVNVHDHSELDLVINTAQLSAEQVSALIVAAAKAMHARERRHNATAKRIKEIAFSKLKDLKNPFEKKN